MKNLMQLKKYLPVMLLAAFTITISSSAIAKKGGKGPPDKGNDSSCALVFKAWFDPAPTNDSLRSDASGYYFAEGGEGFRLYTSGGANSDRSVIIDFAKHNSCDEQSLNPVNPGAAAGFCTQLKDIDMRIERQVQQIDADLCSLNPVPDPESGPDSFWRTIVVNFESGPVDDGSLVDPDRKGNPNKPQALKLSYGCEAQFVPAAYLDESKRALVSRDGNTWIIVGQKACLMTQTGDVLLQEVDGIIEPVWFDMPFGLLLEQN